MSPQQRGCVKVEGIVHGTRWVVRWNIQRFKVMEIIFNLRAFSHLIASVSKEAFNTLQRTGDRMQTAFLNTATG